MILETIIYFREEKYMLTETFDNQSQAIINPHRKENAPKVYSR